MQLISNQNIVIAEYIFIRVERISLQTIFVNSLYDRISKRFVWKAEYSISSLLEGFFITVDPLSWLDEENVDE